MPYLYSQLRNAELFQDFGVNLIHDLSGDDDLGDVAGHRHHDLRDALLAGQGQLGGAFENRADLHLAHLRIGDAEADAAVAHHRIGLVQVFAALLDVRHRDAQRLAQLGLLLGALRHEFVQRRVEEADRHRQAFHRLQRAFQGGLDERVEFVQGGLALRGGIAENHFAQVEQGLIGTLAIEHVLGTDQADPFGAEAAGYPGVLSGVGVGAHAHRAEPVGHGHELLEAGILGRVHHRQGADIDMAYGAVQRDDIAFLQDEVGAGDPGCFGFCVHVETARADDAALAPAAGDERRVGGHAAAGGEDAGGRAHALRRLPGWFLRAAGCISCRRGRRPRRPRR